jgi:RNA polymerase sigma-70 factor, ECF subfamily
VEHAALHTLPAVGSTPSWVGMGDQSSRRVRSPLEVSSCVRSLIRKGEPQAAARQALYAYGPELFGFLIGVLDDVELARHVYADFGQRVGTEIEAFRWRCTLRTWLYSLARRELRDRRLRRRRAPVALRSVSDPAVSLSVSRRRPELTSAISAIRRALTEEDREILILHVDRRFEWEELATTGLDEDASRSELASESRRLQARMASVLERVESVVVEHRIVRPR